MGHACETFVEHYLECEATATNTNSSSTNTTTEHPSIEAHPQQWRMRLPFANTLTGLHLGGGYFRSQEEHILGLGRLAVFLSFLPELVGLTIRWKMLDLRVFDRIDRRLEEGHLEEGHESERLQSDKERSRNERPLLERLHIWVYDHSYTPGYITKCKKLLRHKFRLLEDLSVQERYS